MLQDRQTSDTLAAPADKAARVNLLNWDGKGSPTRAVPAAARRRGATTDEPRPATTARRDQLGAHRRAS